MPDESLYAILRVDERASPSDIRKAYLVLAREKHPDRGAATSSFQTLLHAYEVLSDPARRATYDAELASRNRRRRRADGFDAFPPVPTFTFDFPQMPMPAFPAFDFPPMPAFPEMPPFPSFPNFPFGPGGGIGAGARGNPFPAGFGPGGSFPFDVRPPGFGAGFNMGGGGVSSPFGAGFPFGSGPASANSSAASFDPFFHHHQHDPFRFYDDVHVEEVTREEHSGGEAVVPAERDDQEGAVGRMQDGVKATNPTSSREYVIKDKDGNPCGWGYTATWSSGGVRE